MLPPSGAGVNDVARPYSAKREARIASLDRAVNRLEARTARRDTVYVTDTIRLTQVRQRTDSILVSRTDTVTRIRADTVWQLVEAERQACNRVIRSCEARVAVRDSLIDSLRTQVEVLRPRTCRWLGFIPRPEIVIGAGVSSERPLDPQIQVTAGFPILGGGC